MWLTQDEICAELDIKPRTLRKHSNLGVIERRPDPTNGRKSQYKITATRSETTAARTAARMSDHPTFAQACLLFGKFGKENQVEWVRWQAAELGVKSPL